MDDKRKVTRRRVLFSAVGGAFALTGLDAFVVEPRLVQVEDFRYPIADLHPDMDGFKIAYLSDFHLGNSMPPDFVNEQVRRAMSLKPDAIILGGDYVHHSREALAEIKPALDGISARMGVFATTGNHDYGPGIEETCEEMEKAGVEMVRNRLVKLERGGGVVQLAGVDDYWHLFHDPVPLLKSANQDAPVILLQHNPDMAEEFSVSTRIDLQLAGHMHGGQVRVPWGPAPLVPSKYGQKFREGLVQGKSYPVYVSRGIGGAAPLRPRFWSRPEITLITLVSSVA